MLIPTEDLTPDDVPSADDPDIAFIRFAQTLNGYERVGGEAAALGRYIAPFSHQPPSLLSLEDLRILLFARQRAHYHQGGGWPDDDPLMDEMRLLTAEIRSRLQESA